MNHRETWRPILDAEVRRWSQLPLNQLLEQLRETQVYEVSIGPKSYQVEVEILENTDKYVHLSVSVDDGTLPWSTVPLTEGILRYKSATSSADARA